MKKSIGKCAATLLIGLMLSATVLEANAVEIRGLISCGVWVKDRVEKEIGEVVNEMWLIGYLSGLATGANSDFLRGSDNESIFLWVDNYCRANPLKNLDDAGIYLAYELQKQKGLRK